MDWSIGNLIYLCIFAVFIHQSITLVHRFWHFARWFEGLTPEQQQQAILNFSVLSGAMFFGGGPVGTYVKIETEEQAV